MQFVTAIRLHNILYKQVGCPWSLLSNTFWFTYLWNMPHLVLNWDLNQGSQAEEFTFLLKDETVNIKVKCSLLQEYDYRKAGKLSFNPCYLIHLDSLIFATRARFYCNERFHRTNKKRQRLSLESVVSFCTNYPLIPFSMPKWGALIWASVMRNELIFHLLCIASSRVPSAYICKGTRKCYGMLKSCGSCRPCCSLDLLPLSKCPTEPPVKWRC